MSAPVLNTNDIVQRDGQKYQVVIADDNIFVICPIIYDNKESCDVVNYEKAEIYSNLKSINTLEDLKFSVLRKEDALNDEQRVIRALELCRNEEYGNCALRGCPLHKHCKKDIHTLEKSALDLINRQKAEIECLQNKLSALQFKNSDLLRDHKELNIQLESMRSAANSYKMHYEEALAEIERLQKAGKEAVSCFTRMETLYKIKCKELEIAKSEAIKEFAEKFKKKAGSIVTRCQGYEIYETKQYQISAVNFDNLVKETEGESK